MKEFSVTVSIRSTPERVWTLLTDATSYPSWNPEITRVEGRIALGEKLRAHVSMHGGRLQPVSVQVTEFERPRRMVWTGGMPLGLFTGRRTFTVAPGAEGAVEFTLSVCFSGPMSGLIAKSLGDRQPDIDALAAGLKARAERQ
jgi:uncharacterized protein YndB with AHSA1/START domain